MRNTKTKSLYIGLLASSAICAIFSSPALAQNISATPPPPVDITTDRNGVNLGARQVSLQTDDISIGDDESGIVYSRYWNGSGWRDSLTATIQTSGQVVTVSYGNESEIFTGTQYGYTAARPGSTLEYDFSTNTYIWKNGNGRVIKFPNIYLAPNPLADSIIEVMEPSGEVIKLVHKAATYQSCTTGASCTTRILRLQSATSTTGYQAKVEYQSNDASNLSVEANRKAWLNVSKVTLLNNAVDYCNPSADQCTFSRTWPSATYSSTLSGTNTLFTVANALNHATRYTFDSGGFLTAVKRPSAPSDNVTYSYSGPMNKRAIQSVNHGGDTWQYGFGIELPEPGQTTVDIRDPALNYRTVVMSGELPLSVQDSLNNLTKLQPAGDNLYHSIEMPEGDKVSNTFDGRRNIAQTVRAAKPGSGLASITTSAVYPTSCTNPVTCNKPTSTTDANGNVTDYTYDPVHGGLLTVTAPAPTSGAVRPQTRYTYTPLYAWYKNSSGSIVQAPTPIHRLTGISRCMTTASCSGTADEVKTTIAYGASGVRTICCPRPSRPVPEMAPCRRRSL